MKRIPNLLTGARIVLALRLAFLPLGTAFYAVYALCGVTDVLDGLLARRLHAQSVLGARLDSAADFLLVCAAGWRLWPILPLDTGTVVCAAAAAAVRFAAALTAKIRFGRPGFLHTCGNKLTGLLLFFYPFTLMLTSSAVLLHALCVLALLTAVEEAAIEGTAQTWNADRKSLFF